MRVAVAHEWLVQYAGSERCVEAMLQTFPDARLLTTIMEPSAIPPTLRAGEPSLLQRIPGAPRHHEYLLPFMPLSWRIRRPLRGIDAVISSSHACAKAVRHASSIPHLCYCYTPMRYAWQFSLEKQRFPRLLVPAVVPMMAAFRRWDRRLAQRVTRFVAISRAGADRIRRCYARTAQVIHPPVRTDFFTHDSTQVEDSFLFVGRLVAYKRPDLVVEAFADLPYRLIVVGDGPMGPELRRRATPNVTFQTDVNDVRLRDLYRRACALVHPCEEDFGLVMAEAQGCGTPVVALARGGALDIVEPGVTGGLVELQRVEAIRKAIRQAHQQTFDRLHIAAEARRKFSTERFQDGIRRAVEEMVHEYRIGGLLGS